MTESYSAWNNMPHKCHELAMIPEAILFFEEENQAN
jgi:5-keto 4-deoxyuronate isomerase